jgi:hypothetical protein
VFESRNEKRLVEMPVWKYKFLDRTEF